MFEILIAYRDMPSDVSARGSSHKSKNGFTYRRGRLPVIVRGRGRGRGRCHGLCVVIAAVFLARFRTIARPMRVTAVAARNLDGDGGRLLLDGSYAPHTQRVRERVHDDQKSKSNRRENANCEMPPTYRECGPVFRPFELVPAGFRCQFVYDNTREVT